MLGVFKDVCISGIAAAVPVSFEDNQLAAEFIGERRCKKQIRLTGIKRRHVSQPGQKMSDLFYVAAKKLMEHLGWNPDDIKVVVLLTQNPNYIAPSTAFLMQKMLGIPNDCLVFDVNMGCSAFNVGIQIAGSILSSLAGDVKGICLQGDLAFNTIRAEMSADVIAENMLFGSAGSVTAIEKNQNVGDIAYGTYSDGKGYRAILRGHNTDSVEMNGEGVFNFAINDVTQFINRFKKEHGVEDSQIDFYVNHQAQKLILDNVSIACGIKPEKELRSLEEFGNTSGASVPLSICYNVDKFKDKDEVRILSCGFGVGLSACMAYTKIKTKNILPVIYTDDIYEG